MEVVMHTLTRDEAKQQGYTGYAEHLTTVPCPRLTDPRVYCATCRWLRRESERDGYYVTADLLERGSHA
jgi:hypothetical protein